MKIAKLLVGLALPLLAGACASFPATTHELEELETTTPTGSPFTQALASEYTALADSEQQHYEWFNSQHFARKGLAAAHGDVVPPEDPSELCLGDDQVAQDLAAGRSRLVALLATSAPNRAPALTATAQVKFDCWVVQLEEGGQPRYVSVCRKDFLAALGALEAQAKPTPQTKPTPPSAGTPRP